MKKLIIFLSLISVTLIVLFIQGAVSSQSITVDGKTYHKVGKVNEYRIYEHKTSCSDNELREELYSDEFYTYYFECSLSEHYIAKTNDDTFSLEDVLEDEHVMVNDLISIIDPLKKEELD